MCNTQPFPSEAELLAQWCEQLKSPADAIAERARRQLMEYLWEKFHRLIYSIAVGICGHDRAEDVTHEIYLNLCRYLLNPATADPNKFTVAYISTIARNFAKRWCGQPINKPPIEYIDNGEQDEPVPDAAELFEATANHRLAYELMAWLETEKRQVVNLRFWGAMTFQEIANCLDVPLGTVVSRCAAALKELRQMLRD